MAKRRILVIEDDAAIRGGIVDALEFGGYDTFQAATGGDGLEKALSLDCELVLLDLVLPGRDGMEILAEIRKARATLPVIILTSRGGEADRVAGLNLGADDSVVTPFSVKELLARAAAVLRRSPERPADVTRLELPGGFVDLQRREVRLAGGGRCELSQLEADLLRYLACNAGRSLSRQELLQRVWRLDPRGLDTRTVDMHVARLREKLGDDGADPKVLLTVRGKGYMMAAASGTTGVGTTGVPPVEHEPSPGPDRRDACRTKGAGRPDGGAP
jgi:two-component system, OmpR family, alkaline phosphatase synthesis response regulator PhoP